MTRQHTGSSQTLRFVEEDLALFAAASGDRNPLHLDPVFARRTPFGSCIVHGSLVALAVLGCLPEDALAEVRSLRAWFSGAVLPGSTSHVDTEALEDGGWELRLTGRGKTLTRVRASRGADRAPAAWGEPIAGDPRPMRSEPAAVPADELRTGNELAGEYRPGPELEQLARSFRLEPLDRGLLEGLAWASYVVGMELPGLHGIFAGASFSSNTVLLAEPGRHRLRIREQDERTGRLVVEGTLAGHSGVQIHSVIESFARRPVASPDVSALAGASLGPALDGAVVVVGGSRGLGASLALAFLLRGATVHVVFSTSTDAAEDLRVAAGANAERLVLHRLDARDPAALGELVDDLDGRPLLGVVLSAALPPLPMGVTADSGLDLADYVAENVRLTAVPLGALIPLLDAGGGWVVFCSSPAVEAPPREWPHYVAAKGAVEALAQWVATAHPDLSTVVLRPPKMLTDLTNSPSGRIGAASADEVARRVADAICRNDLAPGLTTLD